MAQNIRFNYLYRDSGNYKKFGFKDFSNPSSKTLIEIETEVRNNLISSEFFYPEKVGIQKFRFHRYCDDFSWYEFEKIEFVNSRNQKQSINEFLIQLDKMES
ncbi:MAG TPA: hypothetical protein DER09_04700 [Prolixibacteraceae bacterium]|nr:hypothetical protein [Prolixibacteraceae bacterium]